MVWDAAAFSDRLERTVEELDWPEVGRLCEELVEHLRSSDDPYPEEDARFVLKTLRRKRHFALMQRVADALLQSGSTDPMIYRQYAQAQLDQGDVSAAILLLERLAADTAQAADPSARAENAEARGLLGRAYKQMYTLIDPTAVRRKSQRLEQAIRAYHDVYLESRERESRGLGTRELWHGINASALLVRAARDDMVLTDFPAPKERAQELATELLEHIERLNDRATMWDAATAVEACVALEMAPRALIWLQRYLRDRNTNAFELASTLRQLTEVWGLTIDRPPGNQLIPELQAALLRQEGGGIQVTPADLHQEEAQLHPGEGLERIHGREAFKSLMWLRKALNRCRAVARVEDSLGGGMGTGFIVNGTDLHPSLTGKVLLTNAHVVSDKVPGALTPDRAHLSFWGLDTSGGGSKRYPIKSIRWSSLPHDLDATVAVPHDLPADVLTCPLAPSRPLLQPEPETFIIGHPNGWEQPMFSIQDNLLLDADDTRIHYRTPTEEGSSGSPVFNELWELIALHHRGRAQMPKLNGKQGTYPANEGIWIDQIKARMADEL